VSRLRGLSRSGGSHPRQRLRAWARPEDLDAFRASGDPDDDAVDFYRIRRYELEHYVVERRI
jgi:hypothetical protein